MPYAAEHSVRIKDPGQFTRIRRQNNKFGVGIDVLFGILADGKTEVQALRFDAGRFTVEGVRAWLKAHDYSPIEFSAATGQAKQIKAMDLTAQDLKRATPASLAAVHARAHEMLGDKHAPTEQIERLHGQAVLEMARRRVELEHATPLWIAPGRGLYMTYPHGELLYQGKKQAMARGSGRSLVGPWIAVSNSMAYGRVTVGEPEAVNAQVFDARFPEHRVTVKERAKWWPDKDRLWIHPITDFQPYAIPRPVVVPHGTNLVMTRVAFLDGHKADPAHNRCMKCSEPPEIDVLWADGRGRAWFCRACFLPWTKEVGDWLELVKAWRVPAGEVPDRWQEHKRGDALGTTDPEQIMRKVKGIAAMEKALHEGAMVAFYVPAPQAERLALGDVEGARATPPQELHMTLVYLGNTAELEKGTREKASAVLQQVAAQMPLISGHVGGTGRFNNVEADGTRAYYASFDAPLLPAFREELIQALKKAGVTFSTQHGFTPHITLCYADGTLDLDVSDLPMDFGEIVLAWGGEREAFPLRGNVAALKAAHTMANSVRVIRSVGAWAKQRHGVAEKAGADELDHRSLGVVTVRVGDHSFPGTASVTTYKTRSTGHVWWRYDVEFEPPIRVKGKGENSWDMGDNHFYSVSVPLDTDDEPGYEVACARVARSIPLDRLIEDDKGGPGSGFFAPKHQGRPGEQGGSTSAGAGAGKDGAPKGPAYRIIKKKGSFEELARLEAQVEDDWTGPRKQAAIRAIRKNRYKARSLILAEDDGELVGIAAIREQKNPFMRGTDLPSVEVLWLATKRRGHGRGMMDRIAQHAVAQNKGVVLGAAASAFGFYEKLGMHKDGWVYYWTPEEAQARTKALDDLAALEPEDGVFTRALQQEEKGGLEPEKEADRSGAPMLAHLEGAELEALLTLLQGMEEKEATQARVSLARELAGRKGGPGSGHERHAGRLGEQGGSLPGAGGSWAHHGGDRDPIGYMGSGAYARGKIVRMEKEHTRREKQWEETANKLNLEFADTMDQYFEFENRRKETTDQDERQRMETARDIQDRRMDALANKLDQVNAKWMTYNDSYQERVRVLLKVNNPLQVPMKTRIRNKRDRSVIEKGHRAFCDMVPNHMVQEAPSVQVVRGKKYSGQRAYYDGKVNVSDWPSSRAQIHEMGHWLEKHNPTVKGRASAFLAKRTQGEKAQKLSVVTGNKSFKDYEYTRKDDFLDPYMGKGYADGSTEIISMGLEMMYSEPAVLARGDPEMFDLVWNTVRGVEPA